MVRGGGWSWRRPVQTRQRGRPRPWHWSVWDLASHAAHAAPSEDDKAAKGGAAALGRMLVVLYREGFWA